MVRGFVVRVVVRGKLKNGERVDGQDRGEVAGFGIVRMPLNFLGVSVNF